MVWLLTAATGGIYLLFWLRSVATELNWAEGRRVLPLRAWQFAFTVLLVLCLLAFAIAAETDQMWPVMAAALALLGLCIHVQLTIGNYIKRKDREFNTRGSYSHLASFILLWLFALYGVAYIQRGINRIIRYSRARL